MKTKKAKNIEPKPFVLYTHFAVQQPVVAFIVAKNDEETLENGSRQNLLVWK